MQVTAHRAAKTLSCGRQDLVGNTDGNTGNDDKNDGDRVW